jgi:hypothetical protein
VARPYWLWLQARERADDHMNMIWHRTPRSDTVSFSIKMKKRITYQFSYSLIVHETTSMTRI